LLTKTKRRTPAADVIASQVLRHDHWPMMRRILRAVFQPRARVVVKSCHASGKTFTSADAVLVALLLGGDVLTTAPTWTQVRRVLWGQVARSIVDSAVANWGRVNETEIRLPTGEFAFGLSTNEGVRFQGFHARPGSFLLIIFDEAPGVLPSIYEAVEGIRSGGDVRLLALGNPTVASGPFFDAFSSQRAGWDTFTIDAFDTPNFVDETEPTRQLTLQELLELPDHRLDHSPRPYLISRRYVVEKYSEWGEKSPLWAARVRGAFPIQAEDALLSLAWLEAAEVREIPSKATDEWEAGIDVAGPGEDETVLVVRHGPRIEHWRAWPDPDPRGDVLSELQPFRDRLVRIKVDSIGQGYYFGRHLEDNGYAERVFDINVGEHPNDREKYVNLKAELYWSLRMRAESGDLAGLADDRTLSQLAGIRYKHNARGQVVIESKEDAKLRRGVKSPDRAEAVMLAFAPVREPGEWGVF
jgi:phage terminase large subunit